MPPSPERGGHQGEPPVPSCLLQPGTSQNRRRELLIHPQGAPSPNHAGHGAGRGAGLGAGLGGWTRGLCHPRGSHPPAVGTRGHAGRWQRSQDAVSFCFSQPGFSLEQRGPARRGARSGTGVEQTGTGTGTAQPRGQPGTESSAALRGAGTISWSSGSGAQTASKNGDLAPSRNFPAPLRWMKAALKGLGLGCSEELDPSISIASTSEFGDMGGSTGPRNPPVPPLPPHFGGLAPTWE